MSNAAGLRVGKTGKPDVPHLMVHAHRGGAEVGVRTKFQGVPARYPVPAPHEIEDGMPKFVSVRMNRTSELASHPVGAASSPADLGPHVANRVMTRSGHPGGCPPRTAESDWLQFFWPDCAYTLVTLDCVSSVGLLVQHYLFGDLISCQRCTRGE